MQGVVPHCGTEFERHQMDLEMYEYICFLLKIVDLL